MPLGIDKPERYFGVISWKVLMPKGEVYIYLVIKEEFQQKSNMIEAKF